MATAHLIFFNYQAQRPSSPDIQHACGFEGSFCFLLHYGVWQLGQLGASFPELTLMADARLSSYSISGSTIDGMNTQAQVFQ